MIADSLIQFNIGFAKNEIKCWSVFEINIHLIFFSELEHLKGAAAALGWQFGKSDVHRRPGGRNGDA